MQKCKKCLNKLQHKSAHFKSQNLFKNAITTNFILDPISAIQPKLRGRKSWNFVGKHVTGAVFEFLLSTCILSSFVWNKAFWSFCRNICVQTLICVVHFCLVLFFRNSLKNKETSPNMMFPSTQLFLLVKQVGMFEQPVRLKLSEAVSTDFTHKY